MNLADSVAVLREKIEVACLRSGRKVDELSLMAVSKFHPFQAVQEAIDAGITLFGESRVQEATKKFPPRKQLEQATVRPYQVHLIGSLQRNKVRPSIDLFDCIQSVDRDELLLELDKRLQEKNQTIDILLELHCGEEAKAGYPDLEALFKAVDLALSLPRIRVQGLMTMAPYVQEEGPIRAAFKKLRIARDEIKKRFPDLDCPVLSMGMSNDYEIAIQEGSSLLRIGTALFGAAPS
ncbi:YggS family pyridoxal phosphate-dependent enzyme [Treponema sp.]